VSVWARAILGAGLCLAGAVFVGQGTNVIHGSTMSGHAQWAVIGAVLIVLGGGLLLWAWRSRDARRA
jgi:hypothetical protein